MNYDLIIIGAGPAGYKSAIKAKKKGIKTALIDYSINNIGGTCLNEGCIPVKSLLEYSNLIKNLKAYPELHLNPDSLKFNFKEMVKETNKKIEELRKGILFNLKNIDIYEGEASFLDIDRISVKSIDRKYELTAKKFIIATGSKPKINNTLLKPSKNVLTSKDILNLEEFPESLLIIGAGAIGCEYATFFNTFGVDVYIVEIKDNIIPEEDEEISRTLKRHFEKQNIKVFVNSNVLSINDNGDKVNVVIENENKEKIEKFFDKVLLSIGRIPNTDNLNLDNAGIETENNFIKVNDYLQTSNPDVYAAGDVINTPAFAHTAYTEGLIALENIITNNTITNKELSPRIIFTDPQIASIGLASQNLKEMMEDIKILKYFFKASGKATILRNTNGFIKLIVNNKNILIGASIIGYYASEIIHQLSLAIKLKLDISQLNMKNFIYAHPTISEIIGECIEDSY